jgi:hypothetical protein
MAKKTGTITKHEGVRQALTELGRDAKPLDIQKYVKDRFGFDMTVAHIYTSRSDILRKGVKKKSSKGPKIEAAAQPQVEPARVAQKSTAAVSLDDLRAIKGLVSRIGPEVVKTLIDLVGG